MAQEKKLWFHRVTSRLWLPISWEGWVVMGGVIGGLFGILRLNGIQRNTPVTSTHFWPVLLEVLVLIVAFFWLTRGRVRK